jgi:hypothetical protein
LFQVPSPAWVAELVDARDLKSLGGSPRAGSSPALGTNEIKGLALSANPLFIVLKSLSEYIGEYPSNFLPHKSSEFVLAHSVIS